MDEERKEYVKEQRKKLKDNPKKFLKEEVIGVTLTYWKEQPLHAIGTFLFWAMIMYLGFGMVQAINNDMIYCDATIDQYDGKLMQTHNQFVKYYNQKAKEMQKQQNPINQNQEQQIVDNFNEQYKMICNYNLTKWNQEPITQRIKTTLQGLNKILLKRS